MMKLTAMLYSTRVDDRLTTDMVVLILLVTIGSNWLEPVALINHRLQFFKLHAMMTITCTAYVLVVQPQATHRSSCRRHGPDASSTRTTYFCSHELPIESSITSHSLLTAFELDALFGDSVFCGTVSLRQ